MSSREYEFSLLIADVKASLARVQAYFETCKPAIGREYLVDYLEGKTEAELKAISKQTPTPAVPAPKSKVIFRFGKFELIKNL